MRGDIPRQGEISGLEPAADIQQVILLPDGHAVGGEDFIQGVQGALGQAALHVEHGFRPQCPRHRQEKAQGRAAFPAGKMAQPLRHSGNGLYGDTVPTDGNLRPQGVETADGGGDVLGNAPAPDLGGSLSQGGADQQAVGLGFGGGDGDGSRPGAGVNGLLHRIPPAFSHPATSTAGTGSTRHWPRASGTTKLVTLPLRFLSASAAF